MEDVKIGKVSFSFWGCLVAFGGFLAFIGFFLAVMRIDDGGISLTGLDLLKGKYQGTDISDDLTFWRYFPFIAAIVAALTVVIEAVVAFGRTALKPVAFALGVVTLVMAIMVLACSTGSAVIDGNTGDTKFYRMIGAYFILYGGIFAAVCGLLDLKGVKSPF